MKMKETKWKTIIALVLVIGGMAIAPQWAGQIWGVLFLFWAFQDVRTRTAFFVEMVPMESNPVLFWIITLMWFGFGLLAVSGLLYAI